MSATSVARTAKVSAHAEEVVAPRYYTVKQVCIILQIDRKTLYKLIGAKQLPGTIRICGDYRIPRRAVDSVQRDLKA